jgi:hypothetical protein
MEISSNQSLKAIFWYCELPSQASRIMTFGMAFLFFPFGMIYTDENENGAITCLQICIVTQIILIIPIQQKR